MPQALPVAAGFLAGKAAATLLPAYAATAFAVGSIAGSLIVGTMQANHQSKKAERAARKAYEDTLEDRAVMVRNATEPRKIVYGECIVSGPIVFMKTSNGF